MKAEMDRVVIDTEERFSDMFRRTIGDIKA
jgi:hypothetical protein